MADNVISPNMGLVIPLVGQEAGPQYAQDINTSLDTIDAHNHAPGSGVQINPSGIDINGSLAFNDNDASLVRSVQFSSQIAPIPAISPDLESIYVSGVDLYYNDGSGNQVRITSGGNVAGASGSITGLVPPASASYSSGTSTFIWQSDVNKAANMDMGAIILRKLTTSSPGITIQPSNSLASNYSIILPAALPASQKFVTLDNAGNLQAVWDVDNVTTEISSNLLQIKDSGVSTPKIADLAVTHVKLGPLGQQISASSGVNSYGAGVSFPTNMSVTITTSGRPVFLGIQPEGGGSNNNSELTINATSASAAATLIVTIERNGGVDAIRQQFKANPGELNSLALGCCILDPVAAGTYTYTVVIQNSAASTPATIIWNYLTLVAYEVG